MPVYIASASRAVTRTLNDLIAAAGYATQADTPPQLILVDTHHPVSCTLDAPRIVMEAPIRPADLAHAIGLALASQPHVPLAAGWQLITTTRQLQHADMAAVALTEKESLLLSVLAHAYPNSVPREQLLKEVWSYGEDAETHTLETHVYRLRAKLGALHPKPCDIAAISGAYQLVKEQSTASST